MEKKEIPVVTIGAKEYYVLNKVGSKYFVLAKYCAGKGYYSLAPCQFRDSKLYAYLQQHFVTDLKAAGVDTDKLYNISILTRGQFERFVKGKLPPLNVPYILMNPVEDGSEQIYAVFPDESVKPVEIRSTQGIRIAMHVDKDYANELMGITEEVPEEQAEAPEIVSDTSGTAEAGEVIEVVVDSELDVSVASAESDKEKLPDTETDTETAGESEDDADDIVIEVIDTAEPAGQSDEAAEDQGTGAGQSSEPTETVTDAADEDDDIVIEVLLDDDDNTAEAEKPSEPEAETTVPESEEVQDNAEGKVPADTADDDEIVIEIVDDEPDADEAEDVKAEPEGEPEPETDNEASDDVEIVVEAAEMDEETTGNTSDIPEETEVEVVDDNEVPENGEEAEPDVAEQVCKLRVITYLDGRRAHVFDNAIEVNGYGYEGDEFCMDVPTGREYSIKARANSKTRILDVVQEGILDGDLTVELNYYTVHVSGDSGIGYTTGAGIYLEGTACSVNVSLVPGHEWDCWNGNPDNRANPYDFVVTGRVYLKARSRINVRVQFRVDDEPYVGAAFMCGMVHINGLDVPVSDNGIAETTVPSDTPVIVKVPGFSGDDASVQIYDDIPSMDLLLPVRYLTLYIRGDNGLAYINGAGIYREGSVVNVDIGCKDEYKLAKMAKFYGNSFVSSGGGKGTIRLTQPTMYKVTTKKTS